MGSLRVSEHFMRAAVVVFFAEFYKVVEKHHVKTLK